MIMGEKLVHESLEYVKNPDALTTPERMTLVRLAIEADDETRRCDPGTMLDEVMDQLVAKGALEVRDEGLFFTGMTLSDAFKAYRVMAGVADDSEGPSPFWYH